jgi:hypothetical protein
MLLNSSTWIQTAFLKVATGSNHSYQTLQLPFWMAATDTAAVGDALNLFNFSLEVFFNLMSVTSTNVCNGVAWIGEKKFECSQVWFLEKWRIAVRVYKTSRHL